MEWALDKIHFKIICVRIHHPLNIMPEKVVFIEKNDFNFVLVHIFLLNKYKVKILEDCKQINH